MLPCIKLQIGNSTRKSFCQYHPLDANGCNKLHPIHKKHYTLVTLLTLSISIPAPALHAAELTPAATTEQELGWKQTLSDWIMDKDAGYIYAVSADTNKLYFIDMQSFKITKELTVGSKPNMLSLHNNILYIALSGESHIGRVDLSTQSILAPLSTGDKGAPLYVEAVSDRIFYSTADGVFVHHYADSSNSYLYMRSNASLYADEAANSLYIGLPNNSWAEFAVIDYDTKKVNSQIRVGDYNHLHYPTDYIFDDGTYIYYAGSKIVRDNLNKVDGTFPSSGSVYSSAQILDLNGRYVVTHEAIFDKDSLQKIATFPYIASKALLDESGTVYLYDVFKKTLKRHPVDLSGQDSISLVPTAKQRINASHPLTDWVADDSAAYLYLIALDTNELIVWDTINNALVHSLIVGSKPSDIELVDGKLYIAFSGENNIGVISTEDAKQGRNVVERIRTKEYPFRIVPDPVHNRLFYTGDDQHQSLRIIEDGVELESVYLSTTYPSLFLDRASSVLYIADSRSTNSRLYKFSTSPFTFLGATPLSTFNYVQHRYVHKDGNSVYFGDQSLNPDTLEKLAQYPEQIIYGSGDLAFGMGGLYDRATAKKLAAFPFLAQHVDVRSDGQIIISSTQQIFRFEDVNELIAFSQSDEPMIGIPVLLDDNELPGKISGIIAFQKADEESAIERYNLYFSNINGDRLRPIGQVEKNAIQDGFYFFRIFDELTVPVGATHIGVTAIPKGGIDDISSPLVLGTLWDAPNYWAQAITITDTDSRPDYWNGSISWKPAPSEPEGAKYLLYYTTGTLLLGQGPFAIVDSGKSDYRLSIPETKLPNGAIAVAILMEDSNGEGPVTINPAAFEEYKSTPVLSSAVSITNHATGADQITVTGLQKTDEIWIRKDGSRKIVALGTALDDSGTLILNSPLLGNTGDKLQIIKKSQGKYYSDPLIVTIPAVSEGGGTPGGGTPGGGTPGGGAIGGTAPTSGDDELNPWKSERTEHSDGKITIGLHISSVDKTQLNNNEGFKQNKVFEVKTEEQADKYEVVFDSALLNTLHDSEKTAAFLLSTPEASWKLPVSDLLDALKQSITKPDGSLTLTVEPVTENYNMKLKEQLSSSSSTVLGNILSYSLSYEHNGKQHELNTFNSYVEHGLMIKTGQIPDNQLAGLTYDERAEKFVPVPIQTQWANGVLKVTLLKKGNSVYSVVKTSSPDFKDIKDQKQYVESIHFLTGRLVISGYKDNTFKPNNTVTRAEFAVMLNRALGIVPLAESANHFQDVVEGSWYERDIVAANAVGLINGYPDGTFKPNKTITHPEMIVMLVNALKYVMPEPTSANAKEMDIEQISLPDWFIPHYQIAVSHGLLLGSTDIFNFQTGTASLRKDGALLIYRLLQTVNFA
jgi:hypothetical protein